MLVIRWLRRCLSSNTLLLPHNVMPFICFVARIWPVPVDLAHETVCLFGLLLSILATVGIHHITVFVGIFFAYASLLTTGQTFLEFQCEKNLSRHTSITFNLRLFCRGQSFARKCFFGLHLCTCLLASMQVAGWRGFETSNDIALLFGNMQIDDADGFPEIQCRLSVVAPADGSGVSFRFTVHPDGLPLSCS